MLHRGAGRLAYELPDTDRNRHGRLPPARHGERHGRHLERQIRSSAGPRPTAAPSGDASIPLSFRRRRPSRLIPVACAHLDTGAVTAPRGGELPVLPGIGRLVAEQVVGRVLPRRLRSRRARSRLCRSPRGRRCSRRPSSCRLRGRGRTSARDELVRSPGGGGEVSRADRRHRRIDVDLLARAARSKTLSIWFFSRAMRPCRASADPPPPPEFPALCGASISRSTGTPARCRRLTSADPAWSSACRPHARRPSTEVRVQIVGARQVSGAMSRNPTRTCPTAAAQPRAVGGVVLGFCCRV